MKEILVWSFDPPAIHRSRFVSGNFPVGFESAEMVEANDVAHVEHPAHALDPPIVTTGLEHIPSIERIAPALSGLAEEVGRNTSDTDGLQIVIEVKELAMLPYVCTVEVHENRDVADNLDLALTRVRVQGAPLLEESKLNRTLDLNGFVTIFAHFIERAGLAVSELSWPRLPALTIMFFAKHVKESEVIEPRGIFLAEAIVASARFAVGLTQEIPRRLLEERNLAGIHVLKINGSYADAQLLQGTRTKPAFVDQALD